MTLEKYQQLVEIVELIDPHRDSHLAGFTLRCQSLEAVETVAYLDDCEHRRLTPRLVMIRHLVYVDYSASD